MRGMSFCVSYDLTCLSFLSSLSNNRAVRIIGAVIFVSLLYQQLCRKLSSPNYI